jgi:hypothetical protein
VFFAGDGGGGGAGGSVGVAHSFVMFQCVVCEGLDV